MQNHDMFELTTQEAGRWREVLEAIGAFDVYHLPSYHKLAEMQGEGDARLFVFRDGEALIAFPMLFRRIDVLPDVARGAIDVSSVYGYGGPIASPGADAQAIGRFQAALHAFLRSRGVVAAFSRLHPLFEQARLLDGYGESLPVGVTLSIDLTLPPKTQLQAYRKNLLYDIRRLSRMGFTCQVGDHSYLGSFRELYHETMDRAGASQEYYFGDEYLEYLMTEMSDVTRLYICLREGRVASAGLFFRCQGILQYHLSGTRADYRQFSPSKLIIEAAREWGNACGATILHLGGGVGGARDSLYFFKSGFTKQEHVFRIWRCVVNPEVYQALCEGLRARTGIEPQGPYFPQYRHPEFQRPRRTV